MTEESRQLPEAFVLRMRQMLGDEWDEFRAAFDREEARALRFNTGKRTRTEESDSRILCALGAGDPALSVPWEKDAWYLPPDCQPGRALWHDIGVYYVQEPSAMSAAAVLDPLPGERVLDLCAAPGGKTTQLAARMKGAGLLIANEIHPGRCRILSRNVERMGVQNCVVTNEAPGELAERFPSFFHRILADAPCSGEGMFRKNPEACAEWSPDAVELCGRRQDEILDAAAEMLLPGGVLVYSTCTFSPVENEGSISRFLRRHGDFFLESVPAPWFDSGRPEWGDGNPELSKTIRIWPHRLRGEGHFVARLRREEGGAPQRNRKKSRGRQPFLTKEQGALLRASLRDILVPDKAEALLVGGTVCFGNQLYRLPDGCPDLDGLRVLRPGLHLGELGKKRTDPSHALALSLQPGDALQVMELQAEDPRAAAWLRGETVSHCPRDGWTLAAIDHFSAGWGKASGGQLKNHVPKGLRRDW